MFHLGPGGAFGVSPELLAGRLGFHLASWRCGWGFTWGPGGAFGAVGVSPGVLVGRLGFHLGPGGAFGVSPELLAGRLGFCRAVGGFLEFAVTPKSSTRKLKL